MQSSLWRYAAHTILLLALLAAGRPTTIVRIAETLQSNSSSQQSSELFEEHVVHPRRNDSPYLAVRVYLSTAKLPRLVTRRTHATNRMKSVPSGHRLANGLNAPMLT